MILKIIGILILILLALLALALCLVLIVPIRYQAKAVVDGGLRADGNVTWMLRLLNITGSYGTDGFRLSVRLLGRELLHRQAEEGQVPEPDEDEDEIPDETADADRKIRDRISDMDEKDQTETQILNGKDRDEISDIAGKIRDRTSDMDGKHSDEENEESRRMLFDRIREVFRFVQSFFYAIRNFFQSIRKKLRQIRNSFQNLQKKIGRLKERADRWIRLWNAEQTEQARIHLWKDIRYLCRHYLPRKLEGRIRFGLEDPAATGQALGILYILSAFTGNRLEVEGEFQDQVLEGEFHLKGHIRACHFLIAALGLLADKNIRLTFRRVQRLRKGSLS